MAADLDHLALGSAQQILGAVGELQFDVLKHRMKTEYRVDVRLTRLPYTLARWTAGDIDADAFRYSDTTELVLDRDDRPVLLFRAPWAVDLVRMTRPGDPDAPELIAERVTWGAGPRAVQALILGGKARALLKGRFYVSSEDIRAVAHPVLRHRLITNYSAEAEGITSDKLIDRLLETIRADDDDGGKLPEVFGS